MATSPPISPPTLVTKVTLPSGQEAAALAITPDGDYLYVANGSGISVIDTATNAVTDTITRPLSPYCSAVAPDGSVLLMGSSDGTVWAVAVSVQNVAMGTVLTILRGFNDPQGIVFTPDGDYAYVADSSNVSIVDMKSLTVTDTISGLDEPSSLAINAIGTYVYVANFDGNSISVIETASNQIQSTMTDICYEPSAIVITPNGATAYVISTVDSLVAVVDLTTGDVTTTLSYIQNPTALAITPDGDYLYVGSDLGAAIGVVETSTNTLVQTIEGPDYYPGVSALTVSPDGEYLYATFSLDNGGTGPTTGEAVVVDTSTNTITGTFGEFLMTPNALSVTPDGTVVFFGDPFTGSMIGYNASTLSPVVGIAGLVNPVGLAITPNGQSLYVANGNGTEFNGGPGYGVCGLVIDVATSVITNTIVWPDSGGFGMVVTPDGDYLYVANGSGISVIDTATNAVTDTITVGDNAQLEVIAITPDGDYVYAAGYLGTVAVIDTATNAVTDTIALGANGVYGIAVSPDGEYVYVGFGDTFIIDAATNTVLGTGPGGATAFTSDSAYAYIARRSLNVVEVSTATVLFVVGNNDLIPIIALAPNGNYIYVGDVFDDVEVWQVGSAPPTRPVPFIRQTPRDDNLGLGPPRQRIGRAQPSSVSNSYRQGFRGTYV